MTSKNTLRLLACAILSVGLISCAHSEKAALPLPDRYPTIQNALPALKAAIRASIGQTVPHYKNRGGSLETGANTSFTGNFDWHSSVHAHWALLSMARITEDQETKNLMLARLTPELLKAERAYLLSNPAFEMPYGRSWLLLLLEELEKAPEVKKDKTWAKTVKDFHRETEKDVLNWLKTTPFPDAPNAPRSYPEKQKFRGDHYSWLLTYSFLQLSNSRDPWTKSALTKLYKSKIEPYRTEIEKNQSLPFDFLEAPALLSMIDQLQGRKSAYGCDLARLPDAITSENAHRAGAYMADQWPCALKKQSQARFKIKTLALLNRSDLWRDDFDLVGHWVPQFIWMGIWLDRGRP